jgi:hypothetical protein
MYFDFAILLDIGYISAVIFCLYLLLEDQVESSTKIEDAICCEGKDVRIIFSDDVILQSEMYKQGVLFLLY